MMNDAGDVSALKRGACLKVCDELIPSSAQLHRLQNDCRVLQVLQH